VQTGARRANSGSESISPSPCRDSRPIIEGCRTAGGVPSFLGRRIFTRPAGRPSSADCGGPDIDLKTSASLHITQRRGGLLPGYRRSEGLRPAQPYRADHAEACGCFWTEWKTRLSEGGPCVWCFRLGDGHGRMARQHYQTGAGFSAAGSRPGVTVQVRDIRGQAPSATMKASRLCRPKYTGLPWP